MISGAQNGRCVFYFPRQLDCLTFMMGQHGGPCCSSSDRPSSGLVYQLLKERVDVAYAHNGKVVSKANQVDPGGHFHQENIIVSDVLQDRAQYGALWNYTGDQDHRPVFPYFRTLSDSHDRIIITRYSSNFFFLNVESMIVHCRELKAFLTSSVTRAQGLYFGDC